MGFDEAWLARNCETAIEPDMRIIDAHHHFWDRPGFRYMFDDFRADVLAGHNIVASVFIEASARQHSTVGTMYRADGPEELRSLGETEFVNGIAAVARSGLYVPVGICAGIVAYVDLRLADRVPPILERHMAMQRVRGIRNSSPWHEDPAMRNPDLVTHPGMLDEPDFRRGFAHFAKTGLTFDAWILSPQIPELTRLARDFPGVKIVLDHIGGIIGAGSYAGRRDEAMVEWREHLRGLAGCPNAYIKLGGMAAPRGGFGLQDRDMPAGSDELAAKWKPYVEICVDLFGPERCMFESNFPVEKQWIPYTSLWNAFKKLSSGYAPHERDSLFFRTALDFYALDIPEPGPGAK
jgi:predicted TIM-barrel fold metal-dependent hydrolase